MIKLDTSSTDERAIEHYNKIKFHLESVIDLLIDALEILEDNKLAKDAKKTLYEKRNMEANAITSILKGLAWDKKPKKIGVEKTNSNIGKSKINIAFENAHRVFNIFFIDNATEVKLALTFLKKNLKTIITSKPLELENLESTFKNKFSSLFGCEDEYIEAFRKLLIMKVFNYNKFSRKDESFYINALNNDRYNRYDLVSKIDNRTCPYCNLNATYTIIQNSKGVTSPSLDHFLDKAKHPIFALSFYNLIPGCNTCNSLKRSQEFTTTKNIHPYLLSMDEHAVFSYTPHSSLVIEGITCDFTIELNAISGSDYEDNVNENIKVFKLKEIYNEYRDQVKDLLRLTYISGGNYMENLNNTYKDFKMSQEEIYKLAFGTYYNENDFHKRSLSKMTKDILFELGMLDGM